VDLEISLFKKTFEEKNLTIGSRIRDSKNAVYSKTIREMSLNNSSPVSTKAVTTNIILIVCFV
jgi:hypothetical protein